MMCLLVAFTRPVFAQEDDFGIRLRRDFGYGAGSNVRGTFTVSLTGDESQVASVAFLIDDELMALVEIAPFRFQFHTDDYGFGRHRLSARVTLHDGRVLNTAFVGMNFLSPEEERSSIVTLFVGLGGVLVLGLVIYALVQALVFKRKPSHHGGTGEVRQYGVLGGTICPKCGRAFPRHIWGINLGVGKFDRCEHCGKCSMTTRATPEQLREAELAEAETQQPEFDDANGADLVRDPLEDTRFFDEV